MEAKNTQPRPESPKQEQSTVEAGKFNSFNHLEIEKTVDTSVNNDSVEQNSKVADKSESKPPFIFTEVNFLADEIVQTDEIDKRSVFVKNVEY